MRPKPPSEPSIRAPRSGTPPDLARAREAFARLVEVVARLRAPDGCPWDREQTLSTIKPFTLEEAHEVIEAIDAGDDAALVEELGDLLLQVVLYAQIAADEGRFDLIPVLEGISEKLVRRHPHVFGEASARDSGQVLRNWEALKQAEKQRASVLEGVPATLPALARAVRLSDKAARVGFDWPRREMLFDKLREEVGELAAELFEDGKIPDVPAAVDEGGIRDEPAVTDPARLGRMEEELGDVLFVVANIARRWGVNPEEALRKSNRKFQRRFEHIERALAVEGRRPRDATLQELEALYQQARRGERDSERSD